MTAPNAAGHGRSEADTLNPRALMQCRICWSPYDPADGDSLRQIEPGTPFLALPEEWTCPNCQAPKAAFVARVGGHGADLANRLAALVKDFRKGLAPNGPTPPNANPALRVAAVGTRVYHGRPVGVLITPWFMSIVILPGEAEDWSNLTPGASEHVAFPSGRYEFLHNRRSGAGGYKSCNILSDMSGFDSQAKAIAVAERLIAALYAPAEAEDEVNPLPAAQRAAANGR